MKNKKIIKQLLRKYKNIFKAETCNGNPKIKIRHRIRLLNKTKKQKRISYSRSNPEDKKEDLNWVRELLNSGLVEEGYGSFVAPMLRVSKKGTTKKPLVLDYRQLNENTVPDMSPIPRIEDMLDQLKGNTVFSTIDATDGFWQVLMEEKSKKYTGFVVDNKHYQWRAMPMGPTNSPSTFQRMMNSVLDELIGKICMVNIDDIIV